MSRIGKKAVPVPAGVTASVNGQLVSVKGPKGELSFTAPSVIKVEMTSAGVSVQPRDDSKKARAMWGMSRTMVSNLIKLMDVHHVPNGTLHIWTEAIPMPSTPGAPPIEG